MRKMNNEKTISLIGVDTGGTFTDFVFMDPLGNIRIEKIPSYPEDPAKPVLEGLKSISKEARARVVHGTTVATNALLEGKTAKTALITTAGFEDVLEIGRQNRPDLYALHPEKIPPIIPRALRYGVNERILADGSVEKELSRDEIQRVLNLIKANGAEAIAICLLHSYANPMHEKAIGRVAWEMGFTVSMSCEVLPEFREFERTSTVAVNASLQPIMRDYLARLETGIKTAKLSVMQSSGGIIPAAMAADLPAHTVLSGPAGGVIAAINAAKLSGLEKIISFDMGGTSTDVSVYSGKPELSMDKTIAGRPIRVPMMDIHTVAAGGGSIAYMDPGGRLKVGPQSAGAKPGPICYGLGGEDITVTDANLYLGRIKGDAFLGGRMKLSWRGLDEKMADLARSLGISAHELAHGIIKVANAVMERAIRLITVQRGLDPREFTLVSFGGAGGLHAVDLARSMGIPKILVPRDPGVFSAHGMAQAHVIRDLSQTFIEFLKIENIKELEDRFENLIQMGVSELELAGIDRDSLQARRSADLRYRGQSFEINVPYSDDLAETFHQAHERLYGFCKRGERLEIVTLRVRLISERSAHSGAQSWSPKKAKQDNSMEIGQDSGQTVFIDRDSLDANDIIMGPALLLEENATTWVPKGAEGRVESSGSIILTPGSFSC